MAALFVKSMHIFGILFILISLNTSSSVEQVPVLDHKGFPNARCNLHCVADELALLAQLQVDVFGIVFASNVGDVDGDEYVSLLLFKTEERHGDGCEVGR